MNYLAQIMGMWLCGIDNCCREDMGTGYDPVRDAMNDHKRLMLQIAHAGPNYNPTLLKEQPLRRHVVHEIIFASSILHPFSNIHSLSQAKIHTFISIVPRYCAITRRSGASKLAGARRLV